MFFEVIMPELPEVETVKKGLEPWIIDAVIDSVDVRCSKLRWPIPANLKKILSQQRVNNIFRRGKYLVFCFEHGALLIHLGMSGRLALFTSSQERPLIGKHDHVDFYFKNGSCLRYTDPRRFGSMLWVSGSDPFIHPLLSRLGVEPLSENLTADYLANQAKKRQVAVKSFIMDNRVVVGIGNIYATESLFLARIHPLKPVNQLTRHQWITLVEVIKQVLVKALAAGGTTLKDFVNSQGKPGYFMQQLAVYGRSGAPCVHCKTLLCQCIIGQRTTVYCPVCQR